MTLILLNKQLTAHLPLRANLSRKGSILSCIKVQISIS